jgi:heat-inducible transcriptional repressor
MTTGMTERSRKILEVIVDDYIATGEPIGSRAVTRRHKLDLSAATVRNVMSDLEEFGFLASPHTSAGRIPTEKGYRYYVDSLLRLRALTPKEKRSLDASCHGGAGIENMFKETSRALSALSRHAGIVLAPRFTTTVFKQIEFIQLSRGKLLMVFVSQSGMVQNKLIDADETLTQNDLVKITNYLNEALSGMSITEVREKIANEMQQEKSLYDKLMRQALELSGAALKEELGGQLIIEGTYNFLDQHEFADMEKMKKLFRAFEQKNTLIDLLDKGQQAAGVQIFIGSESELTQIEGCSLITANYQNLHGTIGTLGVIGPSRMAYSKVIPIVDYTARLISRMLETGQDKEK